ncbi:MAG: YicC family protein, partial [Fervidobacterium sp.]
ITVEIKTLNSKQIDISLRMPSSFREKELELRKVITQHLERGKAEVSILISNPNEKITQQINTAAFKSYYDQICQLAELTEIPQPKNWFDILLRLPQVFENEEQKLDENEWTTVLQVTLDALQQVEEFRMQEGRSLEKLFDEKLIHINQLLDSVSQYETERIDRVKNRLREGLQNVSENYNADRFEQELIYYIEKLDVNEEKMRLQNHLDYFRATMANETSPGKKLGFIAQEMGREINTLGSKANHSEMQKIVVLMKDDLEQIKEQVFNVL